MASALLDLDPDSRLALELDELLGWISSLARTPPGIARVRDLVPLAGAAEVAAQLDTVEELRRQRSETGALVPAGLQDPGGPLGRVGVAGAVLEPLELRSLSIWAAEASSVRQRLRGLDPQACPHLAARGGELPRLPDDLLALRERIEPDGTLVDDASPELGRLRRSRARLATRLRERLGRLLRDPRSDGAIRDDFITQRNGRFVIPVRADAAHAPRGIVHARSSSGATRFVEPLDTVEWNNELVELDELEQAEVRRLLSKWSATMRESLEALGACVEGVVALDALEARARFADEIRGVRPVLRSGGPLRLVRLRHPLLDRRLRQEGTECVPIDLTLDPADRVLVLSGPNTGGKTVALKSVGLAVVMAQAGIPVPAKEVVLPLFRQLRADIGDHQSIEADLSTYSAHVRATAGFLADCSPPALVLFDEIGTGTEPGEGAALAQAVLERMARPGVTVVATTHLGALKAWAVASSQARCAAMEFDPETLRPTYRILAGAPGASAGLEIAGRLGLEAAILARARALLGREAVAAEDYVERLRRLTAEAESRREGLERAEQEWTAERARVAREAEAAETHRRESAERALAAALEEFRRTCRNELAKIRDLRERRRAEKELARLEGRVRGEARRQREWLEAETEAAPVGVELTPGSRVLVRSLGKRGTLEALRGERVEVRLGAMTFTVDREDCVPLAGPAPEKSPPPPVAAPLDAPDVPAELNLIGHTVEEGLESLDRYLDRAIRAGRDEVRVVHGHGTGRLRQAVRRFLASHPHVADSRPGRSGEGGDGATIARLR